MFIHEVLCNRIIFCPICEVRRHGVVVYNLYGKPTIEICNNCLIRIADKVKAAPSI